MQFARHAAALFLLGVKYSLRQLFELRIRKPPFAQVDQHARAKHQQQGGHRNNANIEERALHPRLHIGSRRGPAGKHVVDEHTRPHGPLPAGERGDIGDHLRILSGRGFGPHIGVIPTATPRDADQLVHHGRAVAVRLAGKVAVDPVRLARADKGGAVVVIDKELTFLAIDHRCEDLRHLRFRRPVIRRGGPVDEVKAVARLCHIIAQLYLLGVQQLLFER